MALGSYVHAFKSRGASAAGRGCSLENGRELEAVGHCLQLRLCARSQRNPGDGEITTVFSSNLVHLGSVQSSRRKVSSSVGNELEETNTLAIVSDVNSLLVGHNVSQLLGSAAGGVELLHGVSAVCAWLDLHGVSILVGVEHSTDLVDGSGRGRIDAKVADKIHGVLEVVSVENLPAGSAASGIVQAGSGLKVTCIGFIPARSLLVLCHHMQIKYGAPVNIQQSINQMVYTANLIHSQYRISLTLHLRDGNSRVSHCRRRESKCRPLYKEKVRHGKSQFSLGLNSMLHFAYYTYQRTCQRW